MKVGISYGFAEGRGNARRMIKLLKQNGFSITRRLAEADIIIAHSGGCFLLPAHGRANIVLLVDIPYWPDKHISKGLKEKLALEIKNQFWLKKSSLNALYFIAWPMRWYRMWRAWNNMNIPSGEYASIVAVRNESDTFMHPVEGEVLAKKHGWETKIISGQHDDLWENPEHYVAILLEKLSNK